MSSPEAYVAPAQQNKLTIVRLRSFVCAADDVPEKRVNMSSPERYDSDAILQVRNVTQE
ncbi:TPA: hypothetical protein ACXKGF_005223 [Escherichia coli]